MDQPARDRVPVTYEDHGHVRGPFFHGTRADLRAGDEVVAGSRSHFRPDRPLHHVYFTAVVETAVWGADLAVALHPDDGDDPDGGAAGRPGRIYVVEPRGPFEDDPNVTDKKFPGNPTESYRSTEPLLVVGELHDWEPHPSEVVQRMLDGLALLRDQGRDLIEE